MSSFKNIKENKTVIHGVFLDIFGVGTLVLGEAGVGKSDCALDLLSRGHKLIADDVVEVERVGERLFGTAPVQQTGLLAIRGIGIIDVKHVFGSAAVHKSRSIDLAIEFVESRKTPAVDWFGRQKHFDCMGQSIRKFVIPVSVKRPLSTLVETAVRVSEHGRQGIDCERDLIYAYDRSLVV